MFKELPKALQQEIEDRIGHDFEGAKALRDQYYSTLNTQNKDVIPTPSL